VTDHSLGETGPPLLGLLLRLAGQHWGVDVDAALRAAGFGDIRAAHANVFPFVPPEGIQPSRLARLARVRKQTMMQTLEELERGGYIERRADPEDGRARLVFLTRRGDEVRALAVEASHQVTRRWSALTSPEQIQELTRSLAHLLARLGETSR
jgi:DNA-binding MarR family transcriptional regulator